MKDHNVSAVLFIHINTMYFNFLIHKDIYFVIVSKTLKCSKEFATDRNQTLTACMGGQVCLELL